MYVCSSVEYETPVFKKIVNIIVKDEKVFLLTSSVQTVQMDEHLHAFIIQDEIVHFSVFALQDLFYYRPFDKQYSYNSDDRNGYIVPSCHLF